MQFTGLLVRDTGAPMFVYYNDRHRAEELEAERSRKLAQKKKGTDFTDVIEA